MKACVIDPLADARWADLVSRSGDARVFHHPLWLGLLHDQYRYPMWACCLEDAGSLVAGVPVATVRSRLRGDRLVSLPFSDYVPPVCADAALEEPLMAALDQEWRRRGLPLEMHAPAPRLLGATAGDRFYHHTIAIGPDPESAQSGVSRAHLRNVRRAIKEGVSVERRADGPAIEQFFKMHVLTRRRHGVPTQPKRFFLRLQRLFDHRLGFILLAHWRGRPIAAAVYLLHNGVMVYKYGASDPRHLDKRANPLIQMESMRHACELGCHTLDLGRTDLDNPGLRRFKCGFGAAEAELAYSLVGSSLRRDSVRSVSQVQQTVIRRSPPALGRIVGALLYRHFG